MTGWLVDTSALVRLPESPDVIEWAARIERALVRVSTLTLLEFGYSARSAAVMRREAGRSPLVEMPVAYLTPAAEDRAVEVQLLLADSGLHRAPSVSDLLIAATAELAGLSVLHVDKDFDVIAGVTGQVVERLMTHD